MPRRTDTSARIHRSTIQDHSLSCSGTPLQQLRVQVPLHRFDFWTRDRTSFGIVDGIRAISISPSAFGRPPAARGYDPRNRVIPKSRSSQPRPHFHRIALHRDHNSADRWWASKINRSEHVRSSNHTEDCSLRYRLLLTCLLLSPLLGLPCDRFDLA